MLSAKKETAHACDTAVLACIEFPQWNPTGLDTLLREIYGADFMYDLFTLPGASHLLARDEETLKAAWMGFLEFAFDVDCHRSERLVIVHHPGCSLYRSLFQSLSAAQEAERQKQDIQQAAVVLRTRFPFLNIQGFYASMVDGRLSALKEVTL